MRGARPSAVATSGPAARRRLPEERFGGRLVQSEDRWTWRVSPFQDRYRRQRRFARLSHSIRDLVRERLTSGLVPSRRLPHNDRTSPTRRPRRAGMETPARRQYLELKQRFPDALLWFRMGDFYETFDADAEVMARDLRITLTSREFGR